MKSLLKKHNYPETLFNAGMDKARAMDLSSLRTVKDKQDEEVIAYVSCCVEVLRSSQPNGVMSSAVSLPDHMFTGQA